MRWLAVLLLYSFDIEAAARRTMEVHVDATSGAVLSVAEESAADEARER
jgi:hypothetical protein